MPHHHRHHSSHGSTAGRHRKHVRGAVLLVALLCIVVLGFVIGSRIEQNAYPETEEDSDSTFGQLSRFEWNGQTYRMKAGLTSLLLIGYDRDTDKELTGYRNGGQADFIHLIVIDHKGRTVRQLQIDRDTIADVSVLSVIGKPKGTKAMQIALSHNYGADKHQCNRSVVTAVSNFLQGVPIDGYIGMSMGSIAAFNHAVGGVTVTVEDDLTAVCETLIPGTTLTLNDTEAEAFVRSRMLVGDGKNESRMRRQRAYMTSAADMLVARVKKNSGYARTLLENMQPIMETNLAMGRLINEMNNAAKYTVYPTDALPGTHSVGSDGFMRCEVQETDVIDWIITAFYDPLT